MHHNYLIPPVGGPLIAVPSTAQLREKWTGAMLDQTGRAYAGALRLDFSPGCVPQRALDAIADTLARHPILAARFEIEGDALVGSAPTEPALREALREHLSDENIGVTDEVFLGYRAKRANEPGLRLASTADETGLHVWIGFWTFTCDGASIDLLIKDITRHYQGEILGSSGCWTDHAQMENVQAPKRTLNEQDRLDAYPKPGPYGLDAIRETRLGTAGNMQSLRFDSSVSRSMVHACARANRVTLFALLFAAFQRAISTVSGVTTVITGVPFANRLSPKDHSIVGPLSNTTPVTTNHVAGEPLSAVLTRVQRAVIKAAERQEFKPAELYPNGVSSRTASYELPFPQLFNAWNSRSEGNQLPLGATEWMSLHLLPNDTCRAGFEITLDEHSEQISGRVDMDVDAYGKHAEMVIKQMIGDLSAYLK